MGKSKPFDTDPKTLLRADWLATASIVVRLLLAVLRKFWKLSTTIFLIHLLLFVCFGTLITLVLLLISVTGVLYHAQDMLLFYPEQPPNARLFVESPSTFGLPFENIHVTAKDGVQIHMMLMKQPPDKIAAAHTLIYFHGNAGNIGHRLYNAQAVYTFCACNILLVEYRGYGKSHGTPSEGGFYLDAQAAVDYIIKCPEINQGRLVLFGRSLGGAVAIQMAACPRFAQHIQCLIVENTFTSLPAAARFLFDFRLIHYLPNWVHKNKFPSMQRLPRVKCPALFLSGLADTLIPPRMMQELYDSWASSTSMKRLAKFEAGTHNETWQCSGYYENINRFLVEVDAKHGLDRPSTTSGATYSVDIPFDDGGSRSFTL